MYAIGRASRSNIAVLRLALVAGAMVGRTGKILTFSNLRDAERTAKEYGEWYFVVDLAKRGTLIERVRRAKARIVNKRPSRKPARKAAKKAVKRKR